MKELSKVFIVFALVCVSTATAYSQNCNSYLQQATDLVSQKKYCDAISYYQKYSNCNADADVSTEIAMCKRFCKLSGGESTPEPVVRNSPDYIPTSENRSPSSRNATSALSFSTQAFSGFQLHGGLFMPQGEGNIATGYNLGIKVYSPVSSAKGLSWFVEADALYNGLKSEYKKDIVKTIDAMVERIGENNYKSTLPFLLNVPVTAGVNYAYVINNKFSIYGEVAGGLNLSKFMGLNFHTPESLSYKEEWNMATGFTYRVEAGVLLNDKITIGVRYSNFGSYEYEGKTVAEYGDNRAEEDIKNPKLTLSGISISLGILF